MRAYHQYINNHRGTLSYGDLRSQSRPYLNKHLEVARIPLCSQDYIFRSLGYDNRSKGNVLSSKPFPSARTPEILKKRIRSYWS